MSEGSTRDGGWSSLPLRPRGLEDRMLSRAGLVIGLGVAVIALMVAWRTEHRMTGTWGFSLDDTWIHLQIARNLVEGHGWSYNAGVPVQNSSGPLWTAILALGFVVGSPIWFAKIASALCLLATIWYVWRLATLLTNDAIAAGVAALLAGSFPLLIRHALTAMETSLAALLTIACIDAFYRWRTGRRRLVWPALAALAAATRPECLVVLPLLAAERWWRGGADRNRSLLLEMAVAGIVLLPYFGLNLWISHDLFPTTFSAKAGSTGLVQGLRHGDLQEVLVSLTLYPYVWSSVALILFARVNLPLILATPLGAWVMARGPHRALMPGLLVLLFPLLRGIVAPHTTPWNQNGRYITTIMPLFVLCAGVGIVALVRGVVAQMSRSEARAWRLGAIVALGIAALALLIVAVRFPHEGPGPLGSLRFVLPFGTPRGSAQSYMVQEWLGPMVALVTASFCLVLTYAGARSMRVTAFMLAALGLVFSLVHVRSTAEQHAKAVREIEVMDVALGRWVHDNVPEGTPVAVNDIGAIAYFGRRPVVDAIGLATPELVHYTTPDRLRTLLGLREFRPPYVMVFENWFPRWANRPSVLTPIYARTIEGREVLGGGTTVVYRTDWDRFDRYYNAALFDRIDPQDSDLSLAGHWKRGLRNLGIPSRANLFATAGDMRRAAGEMGPAEEFYRRALEIDPHFEIAWGGRLEMARQRRDQAGQLALLEECLRANPTSVAAHMALGDLRAARGEAEVAKRHYEAALELHPDNVRALQRLGAWHEQNGNLAEASRYRATFQELEPDGANAIPPLPVRGDRSSIHAGAGR